MEKMWKVLREEKKYQLFIKALLMGLLPLLCCMVTCGMQHKRIGQVCLLTSEWNDELFYFKQVEGIIHYGFPQGYFGFNESHALKLSFAAWSPVLVFPWIIWGLLFGWSLLSPVWCNIVLLSLAMVLFVCLVRPTWKQLGVLTLLFCLYTPFVRYMLSGMPEIICFSLLILFYALAVSELQEEKGWKLAALFALSGTMTLMRPYFLLFLLLPVFLWIAKRRWAGAVGSGLILALVLGLYALIKHYLGAAYFHPLFFTDWVDAFFERGLFGGICYVLGKLRYMGRDFLGHTIKGVTQGLASGAFFGGYLVMLVILLVHFAGQVRAFRSAKKKGEDKKPVQLIITGHLAFCFIGMLFALLLMYKLTEGSKHFLTFMAAGIFIISLMDTKTYKKAVVMGAVFAYLYGYMAVDPYDYQIPFAQEERVAQAETARSALQERMTLTLQEVPTFENSVIWLLSDKVDGDWQSLKWQLLYALPPGFGISCCYQDYVLEHIESLGSRYLAVPTGGETGARCEALGYQVLYTDADITFYRR